MTFVIQYFRHGQQVGETNWMAGLPPSTHFIEYSLSIHQADRAVIFDDNGYELIVEQRQKYHA